MTLHYNDVILEYMIHKAKDLSSDQKHLIESLAGRRVLEDDTVSVRVFDGLTISDARRQEIADGLRKYFAEVDKQRQPGSPEEAEEIISEAIRNVRSGYRSDK